MAKILLETEEQIIDPGVKLYGAIPTVFFKLVCPIFIAFTMGTIVWYFIPALIKSGDNPAIQKIAVFKVIMKVGVVLLIAGLLALLYLMMNYCTEKLVLTNKAIVRQNIFSVVKINYKDITNIQLKRLHFNLSNNQYGATQRLSYFIGLLIGARHLLTIYGKHKNIKIDTVNKKYALAMMEKLYSLK